MVKNTSTTGESKSYTSGYIRMGAQQGWQCPVCGNVNSPWTMQCPCRGNMHWDTVTTTNTNEDYEISLKNNGTITKNPYEDLTTKYQDTIKEMIEKSDNCGMTDAKSEDILDPEIL